MTKKVAILFSGLPRLYEESALRWQQIINDLSADVFIHNWRVDDQRAQRSIIEFFRPSACQIDEPETFNTEWIKVVTPPGINAHNAYSSLTSKKRVFDLMVDYYTQRNLPYPDTIIVSRPDLLVSTFDLLDMNNLVIPMEPYKIPDCFHYNQQWLPSQQDVICYGTFDAVKVYCNLISNIGNIYEKGNVLFIPEWLLATHLWMNKTLFYNHVMDFKLVRP